MIDLQVGAPAVPLKLKKAPLAKWAAIAQHGVSTGRDRAVLCRECAESTY